MVVAGIGDHHGAGHDLRFLGQPLSAHELAVIDDVFSRIRTVMIQPEGRTPSMEINA
ncbi:hypothetical protein [Streptomyces hypolithicus]